MNEEPEFKNEIGEVYEDRVAVDRGLAGLMALLMKGFAYLIAMPLWVAWLIPRCRPIATRGFELVGAGATIAFVLLMLALKIRGLRK